MEINMKSNIIQDSVNFRRVIFQMMQNELATALLNILPAWSLSKKYKPLIFFILL